MIFAIVIALIGVSFSCSLTWVLVRRSGRLGLDNGRDAHRKFEKAPVSRLGGLSLGATFALVFLMLALAPVGASVWRDWLPVLLVCLGFLLLGLIDDLFPLGAKRKLLGQVLLALLGYAVGLRIDVITSPAGDVSWSLGGASLLVTVMWIVAIPNIINLIDGMDGLAPGLAFFVSATLCAVLFVAGQTFAAILCLGMAAALLGFLVFNFPPARIYLGDGGAYFIGAYIATVSMQVSQKGSVTAMFFVVLIALGLPILDTSVAILRRGFVGMPLFHADAHHVHHYLQRTGFSKRRALLVLYACCLAFCGIGLTIFWTQGIVLPTLLMAAFLGFILVAKRMEIFTQWSKLRSKGFRVLRRRRQIRRAHAMATYLMHELEHCRSKEEFDQLFDMAIARLGFVPSAVTLDSCSDGPFKLDISNPGNPQLCLFVPRSGSEEGIWRLMGNCLYAPFVEACYRFPTEATEKRDV